MLRKIFAALCCLLLALQWACTFNPVQTSAAELQGRVAVNAQLADDAPGWSEFYWGQVSFHIDWPEEMAEPQWFWDLYLAEQVFSPLLEQFQNDIVLWRLHRRAGRDSVGHRFSVMFFASKPAVAQFYKAASEHPKVLELKENSLIKRISLASLENDQQRGIDKGADKSWSPSIQKHWPYFMYGVSRMWLGLLVDISRQQALQDEQSDIAQHYRSVHEKMDLMWNLQGGHAFLHHLNGIFGYRELTVIERKKMRF